MRCYLIRHGITEWNATNRIQGHSDIPLSDTGHEQARRVGGYFARRPLAALYTSHLARSRQTAEAIAAQTGLPLTVEQHWAEIHLGEWEGLTPDEVNERYDGAYHLWRTEPSRVTIPRGEPVGKFRERVRVMAADILARHADGDVAIVCHGGVIAALLADWLEADYDLLLRRLVLDNGGLSAIDRRSRPPHVLWINGIHHLASEDGHGPADQRPLMA